jgi:ParB/RepB/Spo0J family partition protein
MNKPVDVMQLEAELVPLDVIIPSSTHIQRSRRKRFSEEGILELAASIATTGVINPILVRPFPPDMAGIVTPTPKYELVAGERRYLASKRAGLAHIPCVIRALDDAQVLEAQLVENLQRADLNPLEESEGYAELHELKGYDAERIGELIGKSKSYVYARMKLRDLCADARALLDSGGIDFSKALLLARLPATLQVKGIKLLTEQNWQGDPISYKRAFAELREKFMTPLSAAPFGLDDADLFQFTKRAGAKGIEDADRLPVCVTCPHNSANDIELQRDLKSDAHVCTNTPCFELKINAIAYRRRQEAEAANRPIVAGDAAKKIIPRKDKIVGHVDLDQPCDYDDFPEPEPEPKNDADEDSPAFQARLNEWEARERAWRGRTFRELLQGHELDVTLVEDPKTKRVRELVPFKAAAELLKKKAKIELPDHIAAPERPASRSGGFDHAAWQKEQDAARKRQERETAYRTAVAKAIAEKCSAPLTREDIVDVADVLSDDWIAKKALKAIYGSVPEPGQLKDAELGKFVRLALIADSIEGHGAPGPLLAMAKRFKVDAAKIKRELETAEKAAEKKPDAPAATKAPAPAKKKAAGKKPAVKAAAKKPAAKKK